MNPTKFICFVMLLMFETIGCEICYRDILTNINTATKEHLSSQCKQYLNSTTASTIDLLIDSSSSIHLPMGNYDKCLEIEEVDTKFCKTSMFRALENNSNQIIPALKPINTENIFSDKKINFLNTELHYCVCKSCSAHDLNIIFNKSIFEDGQCSSRDSGQDLDALAIIAIIIFAIIGLLTLMSTAYDFYLIYSGSAPIHLSVMAFSLCTNGRKLFHLGNSQQLRCLNGIKSISMLWVVLGHVYMIYSFVPLDNYNSMSFKWLNSAYSQYATSTVSVDTFLIIGGFLNIYTFQAAMDKGVKFNVPLYYFHRYWRLTPALAALVLAHAALFNFFGSGPLWQQTDLYLVKPCKVYWWTALLYIQNYVNLTEDYCVPQSWYLCIDMQLYLILPLILVMIRRWPRWGYSFLTIVSLLSIIDTFFIGWIFKLNGQMSVNIGGIKDDFMKHYYHPTHTRMLPYLLGIMLGHVIYDLKTSKKDLRINLALVLLGWILSLVLMATCIFGGASLLFTEYNRLANSFYIALMRPTWTIATCWVIFACLMGYGGPIDKFLSLSMFQIFSRLCYSIYLVQNSFIFMTNFSIRSPLHFSDYYAFHKFLGDLFCIMGIAVAYTLVFESPFIVLEKVLLRRKHEYKQET